jgi:xylulokinase
VVFVGIDIGTQSLKAVVCAESFAVLGAHAVPYGTRYPAPGCAEQDAAQWEQALPVAIAGALSAAGLSGTDVKALAIAGQLDGCVAVDEQGNPVSPCLIWQDKRAHAYLRADRFDVTGQVADPSHMAPKIAWLIANGMRGARYHQPTSYLVERWTGAAVLDPAHASTTLLYDLVRGIWSPDLLAAYGIDERALPIIKPATAIAGTLVSDLAGIPAGTPVAVGTGDDFATPLGAGVIDPGRLVVALGTAEVVGTLAQTVILDRADARAASDPWRALAEPMVETHAYPTGRFFVENPGWLSGGVVRWATQLLGLANDVELDALAASAPAGAGGVTFLPALSGGMTPVWRSHARGTLHGLTAAHDRTHVARAVLEGLAFACRDVATRLGALGLPLADAIVLGGGGNSAVWTQIRADALQLPHHVAARTDTCAIAAAMLAAVAIGAVPTLGEAAARVPQPARTVTPRGNLDEAYDRYCRLVRSVAALAEQPWA